MSIFDLFCNVSKKYEPEYDEENDEVLKKDKSTITDVNTSNLDNIDINHEISKLNKKNIYYLKYKRRTSLLIKKKSIFSYKKLCKCCLCCCCCKTKKNKNKNKNKDKNN